MQKSSNLTLPFACRFLLKKQRRILWYSSENQQRIFLHNILVMCFFHQCKSVKSDDWWRIVLGSISIAKINKNDKIISEQWLNMWEGCMMWYHNVQKFSKMSHLDKFWRFEFLHHLNLMYYVVNTFWPFGTKIEFLSQCVMMDDIWKYQHDSVASFEKFFQLPVVAFGTSTCCLQC